MKKPKIIHDIKLVDLKNIRPNKYNPNILDEKKQKQLEKEMLDEGWLQPLLLREIKDKKYQYEIIDGEHRYRAGLSAGFKQAQSIIVNKKLPDAMISTINMNNLRGEFDTLKLAEIIHDLHHVHNLTLEELEAKLGYSQEELQGLEDLTQFDFDQYEEHPQLNDTIRQFKFEATLTEQQYEKVMSIIESMDIKDNAEALMKFCKKYQNG